MNNSKKTPTSLLPWLTLLGIVLFTAFLRYNIINVPFERDEGEYAYGGQLLLQGVATY